MAQVQLASGSAAPARPDGPGFGLAACTAQHRGDRREQQDRVALLTSPRAPHCALAVLADGVGGSSGGALAAETVVAVARRRFEAWSPDDEAPAMLFASLVEELNTVLRLAGITAGVRPHSTLATLLVQQTRVDWCHVGDSRLYHVRDRQPRHCTRDHVLERPIGRPQAQDAAPAAAIGQATPSVRRFVRALGEAQLPPVSIGSLADPRAGDTFLLCSDGLWNYFDADELAGTADSLAPREAAATLIERARERALGQGDNCSLVLVRLIEASRPAAPAPAKNRLAAVA